MSEKPRRRLEDLVPPLDLCKQIPEGAFAESAMVWIGGKRCPKLDIVPRENLLPGQLDCVKKGYWFMFPAPTLAEIMADLNKKNARWPVCEQHPNGTWIFKVFDWYMGNGKAEGGSPAFIALKMWLDLKGQEFLRERGSK